MAAEQGHLDIVKHLFLHGADISAKDVDGVSMYAIGRRAPPSSISKILRKCL